MSNALRIVIVEDNFLLAEALSDTLTSLGYSIVACCGSLREAMIIVEAADFDLAVVDLNLHDLDAAPILDQLIDRHIPAMVATGTNKEDIAERFAQLPRLKKPYTRKQLQETIGQMQASGLLRIA